MPGHWHVSQFEALGWNSCSQSGDMVIIKHVSQFETIMLGLNQQSCRLDLVFLIVGCLLVQLLG
ncbi:hypothetical protein Lalb_Chr17g0337581 [Lupinus albus]|uniref:Uncharacterized protein n=1 Tax=Lupinus albus TaxID=3870 RepID=A0A6A4NNL5_LUPAL|nr:hypothetical protein Lalb_Chr17g0337581 [Lupinus albus]